MALVASKGSVGSGCPNLESNSFQGAGADFDDILNDAAQLHFRIPVSLKGRFKAGSLSYHGLDGRRGE